MFTKKTKTKAGEEGCGNAASLYLRSDCINWLLQYAADELVYQGVERNKEEEDEKTCNSEVAGMHLGWDFGNETWTATFVDGVHVGAQKASLRSRLPKNIVRK